MDLPNNKLSISRQNHAQFQRKLLKLFLDESYGYSEQEITEFEKRMNTWNKEESEKAK